MQLKLITTNKKLLIVYILFLKKFYQKKICKIIYLPTTKSCLTLLKSPHVHKKAKEQFLIKKYKAIIFLDASILNFNIVQNVPPMIQATISSFSPVHPPAPASFHFVGDLNLC